MAWRRLLTWTGIALAALVALALLLPLFLDVDDYRGDLTALASESLGREVRIEGPLSLSLLPGVSFAATDISIANLDGPGFSDRPLARLAAVDAELALWPLLSGRVEVARFVLRGPDILLERGADGRANWEFAVQAEEAASEADTADAGNGPRLSADHVAIEGGRLSYRDGESETTLEAIEAELRLGSLLGPFEGRLAASHDGNRYGADVSLGRLDKTPTPLSLAGELGGRALGFEGAATIDPAAPVLAGSLEYGNSRAQLDLRGGIGERTMFVAAIEMARLDLTDFEGPEGASPAAEASDPLPLALSLPEGLEAEIALDVREIVGAPLEAGPVSLAARLSGGTIEIETAEMAFAGGGRLTAAGQVTSPEGLAEAALTTVVSIADLHAVFDLPPHLSRAIELRGRTTLSGNRLGLSDIEARIGDSRIRGRAGGAFGARPQLAAELTINRLDLADYMGDSPDGAAESSGPLSFPAAERLDGGFALKIDSLAHDGRDLGPAAVEAQLAGGTLSIDRLSLGREDSLLLTASGRIRNLAEAPRYGLDVTAAGAELAQALALAGVGAPPALTHAGAFRVEGRLEGTAEQTEFDLRGRLGELAADAKGRAEFPGADAPRLEAELTGSHRSLTALARQFGIEGLASGENARPLEFAATLSHGEAGSEASGRATAGAGRIRFELEDTGDSQSASLDLEAADFVQFMQDLGADYRPAEADLGGLTLHLAASARADELRIEELSGQVGPVALRGNGRANLSGAVPVVALELEADDVPLDALLPAATEEAAREADPSGPRWSDEPIDVAALEAVDGTLTLRSGRLSLSGYVFEQTTLRAESRGRQLTITQLSGRLFGGAAELTASLDAAGAVPTFATDIDLQGVDLDRLMEATIENRPASGTAFFEGSYRAAGASQVDLIASLTGTGHLGADSGVIRNIDLVALNRRMGTLSTVADFARVTASTLGGGQTAYRHLGFDLVAENGTLRSENFMADIDGAEVDFAMTADLPPWTIDSTARFALAEHPNAPPVGARITGSLAAPDIAYRTDRLKQWAVSRFGLAVGRAITSGEGIGVGDFLFGGRAPGETTTSETQATQEAEQQQQQEQQPREDPARSAGETLLRGLFGGDSRRQPEEEKEDDGGGGDGGGGAPQFD